MYLYNLFNLRTNTRTEHVCNAKPYKTFAHVENQG